jgi:ERO1-like protein alpha
LDQLCKEDKLLFKIISGLHSNINIHLSMNYLDIVNNITSWNVSMYYERVGKHTDRINNMFYLYSLLSRFSYLILEHF